MDTLLIDEWLLGADAIDVIDDASVSVVREQVREKAVGFPAGRAGAIVNVASELARNQLAHARRGEVVVRSFERNGVKGVEVIAADRGEGIVAPAAAIAGRPRDSGSLGVGLSAVLELSDEVDIDVRVGEGTCVWARKFAEPMAKRRQVGIFGRHFPGEHASGDHACFIRRDDTLLLGVADGLGHGVPARTASNAAIKIARGEVGESLDRLLQAADRGLTTTRGAVMALARFKGEQDADVAAVGNIAVHVHGADGTWRASSVPTVLGGPSRVRSIPIHATPVGRWDALVLFTDGLSARTDIDDLALLREHPIVIAHRLAEKFGRDTDDMLVLVAR